MQRNVFLRKGKNKMPIYFFSILAFLFKNYNLIYYLCLGFPSRMTKRAKVGRTRSLNSTFAFVIPEGNPKLCA